MNRAYSLVWNARLQAYCVASETARRRGKSGGLKPLVAILLSALALSAHAQPQGGQVSVGSGSIATAGTTTTITQQTQNMAINWQSFGTASSESIVFQQPNASAIALNRVLGSEPSNLLGSLTANGQVWILNPNGVVFGTGSQVNVGGLLATTLQMSDDDFMAGKRSFSGTGGLVTNKGNITTTDGGYVALLGGQVSNEGVIAARLGTVALAAGNSMTLDFAGDRLLNVQVDQGTLNALTQNRQLIRADGGTVLLTAKGVDALFNAAVNNDGVIEARTVGTDKGKITLLSDMKGGTTTVAGRLDASATDGGDGGFIETSGATVKIADGALISTYAPAGKTGQWLIDPNDYTIAASGGDITGATLSNNLENNNVTISTATQGTASGNGDIHVNDNVSWSADTKLSLIAERNVNVNADINASGQNAGLSMTPGASGSYALQWGSAITLSGSNATLDIAGQNYKLIHDVDALQAMQNDLGGSYALGNDVDASATSGWPGGAGFAPIGSDATKFNGVLDGLGHQVSNLFINRPTINYIGLIGFNSGTIRNLGVVNVDIKSDAKYLGTVAGFNTGLIDHVYATGKINWGKSASSSLNTSGGLVARNTGEITNSYSTVDVTGLIVGGLTGENDGTLSNVFATGIVSSSYFYAGGLVAKNNKNGIISNAYAIGDVSSSIGESFTGGGLVGVNSGSISQTYANGTVSAVGINSHVGTLVGSNLEEITNSYGNGTLFVGGIELTNRNPVGSNSGNLTSVSAISPADTKQSAVYVGFNFDTTWRIYDGNTTPLLQSLLIPINVTANNASKIYDGNVYSGSFGYSTSKPTASLSGTATVQSGSALGAVNAGAYTVGLGGLYSDRYDISYVNGTLTINPKTLTASLNGTLTKVYDGNTNATLSSNNFASLNGLVGSDSISITVNQTNANYSTANAGSSIPFTATLGNANFTAGSNTQLTNYVLPTSATGTGQITQAALQIRANDQSKTYGNTLNFNGSEFTSTGLVGVDTIGTVNLASGGSGALANVAGNPYSITAGNATGGSFNPANYAITYTDGYLTINPKTLTASLAGTISKAYDGTTSATLSSNNFASLNGLVGDDSIAINQTIANYSTANAGTSIPVTATLGNANFTAGSNTQLTNYVLPTSATGTGQITQAALQIRANDQSKTYGNTLNFNGSEFTSTGLVGVDTVGTVNLASAGSGALANVAGNPYAITASNATGGSFNPANYAISYTNGSLTVTPAQLTATANNAVRTYNGTAFSGGNGVTYNGLVNGDSLASVVSGTAVYGGNSQGAVNAGNYAITLSGLSSASANYSLGFVNGNLIINPKQLYVGIIGTPTKVYDGNNNANLTSSNYWIAGLVGTDTVRINQTQGSFNSPHVNTAFLVNAMLSSSNIVAGAGTLATNYLLPSQTFGLGFIKPATLTYLADLRSLSFGSVIPTLTGNVVGFVNGDNLKNATTGTAVWTTAATSKTLPGKYAINGSGLTANYGDYTFVQAASNATALTIFCPTKTCK